MFFEPQPLEVSRYCSTGLGILSQEDAYNKLAALAIAKRYLAKLVEKTNFYYPSSAADPIRMFAAGAGHHPCMLLTTYAIDRALPERLQPELLEMYRRLSNIWQEWSNVVDKRMHQTSKCTNLIST
ncbi:Uncharacterized protein HZ326_30967 [Fusarium oxysporum f. sp. albedinis]|nr:Uncharacterized protein HZ326_30967 [Fusarium oxysporum f. sp. albedinis]